MLVVVTEACVLAFGRISNVRCGPLLCSRRFYQNTITVPNCRPLSYYYSGGAAGLQGNVTHSAARRPAEVHPVKAGAGGTRKRDAQTIDMQATRDIRRICLCAPHTRPTGLCTFGTVGAFSWLLLCFWARDFRIRAQAKHRSGSTGRQAFFPPSRRYHPSQSYTSPCLCSTAENLITRAFVLKGPLSRPRRIVFRALCVSFQSFVKSHGTFFENFVVFCLSRQLVIYIFVLLETYDEAFFTFFSRKYRCLYLYVLAFVEISLKETGFVQETFMIYLKFNFFINLQCQINIIINYT